MRRLFPAAAVSLFALFAAQPLFVNQLTCSDDSAFHIGRAVALERLIDSGHFFPRWSPHMAHGYGYPFFNYYGPLSTYILVVLHKLGLIYPLAFHVFMGLCIWLAGLATYAFAREWWGEAGGVAAAVVYLTAPYLAYDILFRAVLAETFALVWPPIILLALHRALREDQRLVLSAVEGLKTKDWKLGFGAWSLGFGIWDFLAAFSFAALLYTHNTTSLAVAPLIAGYVALLAFLQRDLRPLIRGGLILTLGLALAARFWLPALLETSLIQSDRLLVPPIFTYYTNYLTLGELFAPPTATDPLLINPSPAKALGLVATALALVGFAALAYRLSPIHNSQFTIRNSQLAFGIWNLGFGVLFSLLTLPLTRFIWDDVPLIKFIQFPWRFLGPASLCAALLAGAAVHGFPNRQWPIAAVIAFTAALGHLSWWYPRYCSPFTDANLQTLLRYEIDTATLGTTAKGEYLPKTVHQFPADDSIAQSLIRGERPDYLAGLPADSTLTPLNPDPLDYRAAISLPSEIRLTFNQFYFPGWEAALDDRPLPLQPTPETGLIALTLPAGEHTLKIRFGNTPMRTLGDATSILALLLMAYGIWHIAHRQSLIFNPSPPFRTSLQSPVSNSLLPILIPLTLLLARPLLIDRTTNILHHSPFNGKTLALGQPLNQNLSSGLTILSTDFPSTVESGSQFDAILYATARDPVASDYRPRFDLVDSNGAQWADGNTALPPRWHKEPPETHAWPPGQYAQWARRLTVAPGTPPGEYQLTAIVFDRATLAADRVIDENGNPASSALPLGTIRVARPATPPALADLNIEYRDEHDFGPITLLGYNLDRTEARPGEAVLITLFLRADDTISSLQSPDLQFNLFTPSYPTSQWQPGDIWRFQVFTRLPADAASGPYHFNLQWGGDSFSLRSIQLTAPERVFTAPPMDHAAQIRFGNTVELSGYTINAAPESIQIDLLWHALATPESDLSAFIHIEDKAGMLVAQSDGTPADGNRPTTGWLAGEYILDSRTLPSLPTGEYTIRVGFADRLSGQRLAAPDQDRPVIGVYKAP
jgi:hypothetical protein